MTWNWAQHGWREFCYDASALERRFLMASGAVLGAFWHVGHHDREQGVSAMMVDVYSNFSTQLEHYHRNPWYM